jgi:hypothetical protein
LSPDEIAACEQTLDAVCVLLGNTAGGELGERLTETTRTYSKRTTALLANFSTKSLGGDESSTAAASTLDTLQRQWTVGAKDVAMVLAQIVASRSLVRRGGATTAQSLYEQWLEPMQMLLLEQAIARAALRYTDESTRAQELIVHCVGTIAADFARHCPPMAEQTRQLLSRARRQNGST